MSAYGPALFVARRDKKGLSDAEQKIITKLVVAAVKVLKLKDYEDKRLKPTLYDYNSTEADHVGLLLFSWYGYDAAPEDFQKTEDESWAEVGDEIGQEIEKTHPKTYSFKCYYVED